MKSYSFIIAAIMTGTILSCTSVSLDPLEGKYQAAEEIVLSQVVKNQVIKKADSNIFDIELTDGKGGTLAIQLYGKQPFADDATYGPASAANAGKANYILENTKVNGKGVTKGLIDFIYNGEGYEVLGNLWTSDDMIYRIKGIVDLQYVRDLEAVRLTKVISVSPSEGLVTVVLATEGVSSTFNPATYQTEYTGTGNYLSVDFYSSNGKLVEGTYKPSAEGGKVSEGQYGIGWDPGDLYNIGWYFTDWGTCWWTVADGAAPTAQKISSGNIDVKLNDGVYTISYKNMDNGICFSYTGAIESLLPIETLPATELTQCFSATSNLASGTNSVSLVFGTEGVVCTTGMYGNSYSGVGHYLTVD
ncbi:MAG: hypothetical protein HUJ93_05785, partial [Bacteroidales bacterium]|nr:hypothetical protein [Bacteroidales bacterium]